MPKSSKPTIGDIIGNPRLSAEFRRLNPDLAEKIKKPDSQAQAPRARAFSPEPEIGAAKAPKAKKMSRGEIYMEAWLKKQAVESDRIHSFDFEAITLKLGENRCEYTPDFLVRRYEGRPLLIEVKGSRKWEDSLVKFKTARTIWGWLFDFELWEYTLDGWRQLYA